MSLLQNNILEFVSTKKNKGLSKDKMNSLERKYTAAFVRTKLDKLCFQETQTCLDL